MNMIVQILGIHHTVIEQDMGDTNNKSFVILSCYLCTKMCLMLSKAWDTESCTVYGKHKAKEIIKTKNQ